MVTDSQVRILMKLINKEELSKTAAAKAGMIVVVCSYRQSAVLEMGSNLQKSDNYIDYFSQL